MVRKNGTVKPAKKEKFKVINRSKYDPEKKEMVKFEPEKPPKKIKPKKKEEVLSQEVSDITQQPNQQFNPVFGNVLGQTVAAMSYATFMTSSVNYSGMMWR